MSPTSISIYCRYNYIIEAETVCHKGNHNSLHITQHSARSYLCLYFITYLPYRIQIKALDLQWNACFFNAPFIYHEPFLLEKSTDLCTGGSIRKLGKIIGCLVRISTETPRSVSSLLIKLHNPLSTCRLLFT